MKDEIPEPLKLKERKKDRCRRCGKPDSEHLFLI